MESGKRVLVVDDDPSVRNMLSEYLGDHGCEVGVAESGAAMRLELQRQVPDVVLLDLHMPGEDGFSLARYLREHHDVSIIMVTGAGDVIDRVVGLEVGADDYVAKPFDPRELLARIRSVLRRARASAMHSTPDASSDVPNAHLAATDADAKPMDRVRVGRCWLEIESRRLFDDAQQEIALTAMEFEVLRALVSNPNRVLSRDQLLSHARNREWEPFDRSIDIRIARLRSKVEATPDKPSSIRTVRNAGYMFVPESAA